ncbi:MULTISPECIES: NYN domain-containing protein [Pseudomonas]|uniref:NYN domain-containing protein n=1 Tax=Pseudomonas TaxID=286 RepID=UPI00123A43E2|nr:MULTISPECIES: NYN domain-containing protein [Pseudomonas]QIB51968.1 NYN domain-containing protein [Pseudomonas sp. OIL-1]
MDYRSNGNRHPARPDTDDVQKRLAVLIDADNAQASIIDGIFEEVAKYGVASVKRIYGDWTAPQLGSWKKVLLDYSIQPIQQFAYTKGKNATDSSLIIDAMDLLYTGRFDGFCLVSSDSDFTRLAARLREEGLVVYGFGEKKTPSPFVSACDKFIYTEILRELPAGATDVVETEAEPVRETQSQAPGKAQQKEAAATPATAAKSKSKAPLEFIAKVIDDISDEDGWANLGPVGSNISKLRPEFDPRLYGYKKLSELIKAFPKKFAIEDQKTSGGKTLRVRLR